MFPFLMKTSYDEKSGRKQVPTLQKFFQTILDLFVKMMRRNMFSKKNKNRNFTQQSKTHNEWTSSAD